MKKSLLALSLLLGGAFGVMAQSADDVRYCGQVEMTQKMHQHHPGCAHDAMVKDAELDEWTRQFAEEEANRGGGQIIYTIPVVFHIIHDNGPENITDDQIHDAMFILNRDFRKQNADTAAIVPEFQDIAADIGIEFRLASLDPDGNCHPGIVRVQSPLTTEGGSEMKSLSIWPRNSYMNVWVCRDAGDGTAGYTFTPNSVDGNFGLSNDGIVLRYDYTGSIGESNITRSRTLTHEVGHWLNLRHTWGPTNSPNDPANCDFDDGVSDTPNTIGYVSCNLAGASCGSPLDNVQNYMEYSYCSRMFTEGQRTRMRAAANSNVAERNELITQANLIETGVINPALCLAKFTVDANTACLGQGIQFRDRSYHGVTTWTWDFGDGTVLTGSDPAVYQDPIHIYEVPGTYSVSLTVANSASQLTYSLDNIVTVFDYGQEEAPFSEGFENEWPNAAWAAYNQNNDLTWEITTSAEYSGNRSLKLRNFSNTVTENIDELISATYDMSAMDTVFLTYHWAYANKLTEETEDRLRIQVSGDCGTTWSTRRTRTGFTNLPTANPVNSQFTPSSTAQWDTETLMMNNPDWMTDGFRVRFEFTGRGGNNLFLDDINITSSDTITVIPTGVQEIQPIFAYSIFPNPSKDQTNVRYFALQRERVSVKMYNGLGQLMEVIADEEIAVGEHNWTISKKPAGIYTVVFEKNGYRQVEKVMFE